MKMELIRMDGKIDFGGSGGKMDTPAFEDDNEFACDLLEEFGREVMSSDDFCKELWAALTNIVWIHDTKPWIAWCSFRRAGDIIASIRGNGNYLDWYCCAPEAVVSDRIANALRKRGWTWDTIDF